MKKNVRSTSIKTYHQIMSEGWLGQQQEDVFVFFKYHPYTTDRQCSKNTEIPINAVTGRRNELVKMGCLMEGDKTYNTDTGRPSYTWYVPKKILFKEG